MITRDYLMDNLKGFLIICVVIGHTFENYIEANYMIKGIYAFIYLFHMEAFIFISGYFTKDIEKAHHHAIRQYLFPYFFFNLLAYCYKYILTGSFKPSWINPAWTLWYLLVIFLYRYLLKYIVKIPHYFIISCLLSLLVSAQSIIQNDIFIRFFTYLPFYILGTYAQKEDIQMIRNKGFSLVSLITLSIILVIMIFFMKEETFKMSLLYNKSPFDQYHVSLLLGCGVRIVNYTIGFIVICCLIRLIPSDVSLLSNIGKQSGCVYIAHTYLIRILKLCVDTWPKDTIYQIMLMMSVIPIMMLSYNFITLKIYHYLNQLWMFIYDGIKCVYKKLIRKGYHVLKIVIMNMKKLRV